MPNLLCKLLAQEDGATAVEYAFVTVLISIIFIAVIETIGVNLSDIFQTVANAFPNAS